MAENDDSETSSGIVSRLLRQRRAVGTPPGMVEYTGERDDVPVTINVIDYNADNHDAFTAETVQECFEYKNADTVTWINVDGLQDTDIVEEISDHYDVHPLLREDMMETEQRPKFDDMDDYLFLQTKMLQYDEDSERIMAEQVSFLVGENVLITFQEQPGDVFDPVRSRIERNKGQIRKKDTDYLLYALIDAVVDNYFRVLEHLGEQIEAVEEDLVHDPDPETLQTVHTLKRELIFLRKSVWPMREVISQLERSDSHLIDDTTQVYLRDVYEHTIQVIDIIETFRDMVSGSLDIYLSSISNKMNNVMKVLTIIATIFIPLTFVAGVYGMNFDPAASPFNMPELGWYWGYPVVLLVMLLIALGEVYYFKKKDWL